MDEKTAFKIRTLFLIFFFFILVFLFTIFYIKNNKPRFFIAREISHTDLALRGKIISKDNFIIAQDSKVFSIAIKPSSLNPNKEEIFYNLFQIYTNLNKKQINHIKKMITIAKQKHIKRVILLKKVPFNIKKNLTYLSTLLTIKKVFIPDKNTNITYGLDIYEENPIRKYPLKNRFEPVLGFIRYNQKNQKIGIGLEIYYDDILKPKQNGYTKGLRDVQNHIIYDNTAIIKPRIDGDNLYLNTNLILQGKIENILDKYKKTFKAKEVLAVVMNSKTGKIVSIASSNRFNPMNIKNVNYTKISHIQYIYEPGSVMKPITLAILLQHKKINIYDVFNAHNGVWYFKRGFTIYDDEPFLWLNVIQAVIHSSNIVFAQLGLKLSPQEFRDGLLKFGFNKKSGIDLPYEYKGTLFSLSGFKSQRHRASNAYGYALGVNLIQLIKAYNVFNNNGIMVTPKIANFYISQNGKISIISQKRKIISPSNAVTILNILRKVVLKGTAQNTNIKGLFIAGKTGTAKISKNGKYINGWYNSSFIGFVNDKKHKYTIGVLVIKPMKKHTYFASQTAVVIFRDIVNTMLEMNLLKKEIK